MARKPADTKPASKPATKTEKPATPSGVGIKEMAAELGRSPRSVRASIRRLRGGPQVGQGGRYSWTSTKDKDYVELVTALSSKGGEDENE